MYREKHKHIRGRGLLSSSALGLTDGLVTNLAFLTGFSGAVASVSLIRFGGIAAMLAGAVSMFFGGILAARSEEDLFDADSARESLEIETEPDEEKQELRELYLKKGLSIEEADMVVTRVSSDKKAFLEDMLVNELHIHAGNLQNPIAVGLTTGLSFLLGAFVPLVPYLALSAKSVSVPTSVTLSLIFLVAAGAWKGRVVKKPIWKTAAETLAVGAVAAGVLYLLGSAFVFV